MRQVDDILTELAPITLDEMDSVKLMNRTDTKFLISKRQLSELLDMIKHDYSVLEVDSLRQSRYKSLYFDTPDLQFYYDHHNGRNNRHKVRMRKYVESDLVFLEVKHKYKGRTNKKRIRIEDFESVLSEKSKLFLEESNGLKMDLEASMWNSFSRITLVNKHSPERMTIDLNLTFEWKDWSHTESDLVIVEVKQEKLDRSSPFMKAAKSKLIRPLRVSKYCIGMVMRSPNEIKYNNFKPKLMAIKKVTHGMAS